MSSGGSFSLHGTIGQPEAGMFNNKGNLAKAQMSSGNYILVGGFWGGLRLVWIYTVNLPLVILYREG